MSQATQKMSVAVSIVIVAYKSRGEIGACLESIPAAIDLGAVEVVVVDNFGRDGIEDLVRDRYAHVVYISPAENLGFGPANNLGFSRTTGRIVLFLNPDTICTIEALNHCSCRVSRESEIGLISPKLVQANGEMDLACRRSIPTLWDGFCRAVGLAQRFTAIGFFSGYNLTHLPSNGTYDVGAINGAFMMARREVLEKVGLFDENFFMYGDDLDLCIRVARAGYRIVYDGRVQITHLKGLSVAKDFDRMATAIFDANRDVYLKHFNPRGSRWVALKYRVAFGLWKRVALARAWLFRYKRVRPM